VDQASAAQSFVMSPFGPCSMHYGGMQRHALNHSRRLITPEVAGSNPAPATANRPWQQGLLLCPSVVPSCDPVHRPAAALTSCVSWVNLGVIIAVVYPVATISRAPWSAARDRPADVVRSL